MSAKSDCRDTPSKFTLFSYGGVSFGYGLLWHTASFFLLFYYTDILEIDPFVAGVIIAIALLWDAISDPIMGALANKFETRTGGYKPWVNVAIWPLAMSFVLVFAAGIMNLSDAWLVTYCMIAIIIFRTCCTVMNIPFGVLAYRMTRDSRVRNTLSGSRMFFGIMAAVVIAVLTLPLSKNLGVDVQMGFALLALIYAGFSVLINKFCLVRIDENNVPLSNETRPLREALKACFSNRPLLIALSVTLIFVFCSAIHSRTFIYVFKYNFAREDLINVVLGGAALLVALFTPIWAWVAARTSKRTAALCGFALIFGFNFALISQPNIEAAHAVALIFGVNIGIAALPVMFFSMIPDTIEVNEFKSGAAHAGLVYGLAALTMKLGGSIANLILGWLLKHIGYVANQEQSPETLEGIYLIMTGFPMVGAIIAGTIIWFYPLNVALHGRLVNALGWRQRYTN